MSIVAITNDPEEAKKYLDALKTNFECEYYERSDLSPLMCKKLSKYAIAKWEEEHTKWEEGQARARFRGYYVSQKEKECPAWLDGLFTEYLDASNAGKKLAQTPRPIFTLVNKIGELFDNLMEAQHNMGIASHGRLCFSKTFTGKLLDKADLQTKKSEQLIKEIIELTPHCPLKKLNEKVEEIRDLYKATRDQKAYWRHLEKSRQQEWSCSIL